MSTRKDIFIKTVETDQIMNPLKRARSEVHSARRLFSISVNISPLPVTGRPIRKNAGTPANELSSFILNIQLPMDSGHLLNSTSFNPWHSLSKPVPIVTNGSYTNDSPIIVNARSLTFCWNFLLSTVWRRALPRWIEAVLTVAQSLNMKMSDDQSFMTI